MISELAIYLGLFLSAFLAATILPMQSEAVLIGLLISGKPAVLLLFVAISGNVLGSIVNWFLGRQIEHFQNRSWFPVSSQKLEKANQWYQRYGRWSLLMSWAPVIGDPLTVLAGVFREPFRSFLLLITVAKASRYLVLAYVTMKFME